MGKVPRKYFERLVENSLDIVVATDTHGRVIFCNDGAMKSLGYAKEEVRNLAVSAFYPSLEEARKVMQAMRDDPEGRVANFETIFVTKSGDHIPVAITGAVIYNDKNEEIGTIGFAKDIREIRRKDQLATLAEIAVGLSHEINNPLTVIWNNLELIRKECKNEPGWSTGEARLETIRTEIERIRLRIETVELMARSGVYTSREYLRGAQMIDLVAAQKGKKSAPVPGAQPELKGLGILVVDDDPSVTASLNEILKHEGCEVRVARSGEEALKLAAEHRFDLVLSDVVMPNMDGYDLYMKLKDVDPDMSVILMTAYYYDKDHIIKRSKMEGLQGSVFKKPINPDHLKRVIAEACHRTS
jgi:PAS domain S-box-containing protein